MQELVLSKIDMSENILIGVLGFFSSLLLASISYWIKIKLRIEKERLEKIKREIVTVDIAKDFKIYGGDFKTLEYIPPEWVKEVGEQIVYQFPASSGMSREEIQKEVSDQVKALQERLIEIENRFPEKSQIDKIASINDALLAERIEQLAIQLKQIESKILSRWDVALVVSEIVGGIIVIVGATYAVLRAIGIVH